ncbi:DUF3017 domain-containing protein [Streptomyces griseoviridis]|uniref:DUF3017 domain-containing protein n=1 Tax=Streptomyces griseoviridis TaxID=45398 RepID=A0A3S9ZPT6_STRGD|nr:DUF3017 domain-containing protein [Streptomyces griseoviridis]QCN87628.1 hypothetical protein DDJ31_23940 [Streptomyces griseoviridis]
MAAEAAEPGDGDATTGNTGAAGNTGNTGTTGAAGADEAADAPEAEAEAGASDASASDASAAGARRGRLRRGSGRFPLFTRDTARPEGGGRAAPRDAPAPVRQWPILAVLGVVALGLLITALDVFRVGTLLIGFALLAGGALRWVMPDVGMLAVRSRFTDICTYGVLGLAIVVLAMMAQPDPWLQIPFLKDTLHFTVSSG